MLSVAVRIGLLFSLLTIPKAVTYGSKWNSGPAHDALWFFAEGLGLRRGALLRWWIPREQVKDLRIDEARWRVTLEVNGPDGERTIDLSHFWRGRWPMLQETFQRWRG